MAEVVRFVLHRRPRPRAARPTSTVVTHPANWGAVQERRARARRCSWPASTAPSLLHRAGGRRRLYARDRAPGARCDGRGLRPRRGHVRRRRAGMGTDGTLRRRGRPRGSSGWAASTSTQPSSPTCSRARARADPLDPDRPGHARRRQLRRDCVEAKEALSSETSVTIPVLLPALRHRGPAAARRAGGADRSAAAPTVHAVAGPWPRRASAPTSRTPCCSSGAPPGRRWWPTRSASRSAARSRSTPTPSTPRLGRRPGRRDAGPAGRPRRPPAPRLAPPAPGRRRSGRRPGPAPGLGGGATGRAGRTPPRAGTDRRCAPVRRPRPARRRCGPGRPASSVPRSARPGRGSTATRAPRGRGGWRSRGGAVVGRRLRRCAGSPPTTTRPAARPPPTGAPPRHHRCPTRRPAASRRPPGLDAELSEETTGAPSTDGPGPTSRTRPAADRHRPGQRHGGLAATIGSEGSDVTPILAGDAVLASATAPYAVQSLDAATGPCAGA